MKIAKKHLRRIIKEELQLLNEEDYDSYRDSRRERGLGGSPWKKKQERKALKIKQMKYAREVAEKGTEDAHAGRPKDTSIQHLAYGAAYDAAIEKLKQLDLFDIKESMDHYEWRHQEDQKGLEDHQADVVFDIIDNDQGISGPDLVSLALKNSVFGGAQAKDVHEILDALLDTEDVRFNVEEDEWHTKYHGNPGWEFNDATSAEDEFIDHGIRAREMSKTKNEGASLDDMPTAWKQVLGSCLGKG